MDNELRVQEPEIMPPAPVVDPGRTDPDIPPGNPTEIPPDKNVPEKNTPERMLGASRFAIGIMAVLIATGLFVPNAIAGKSFSGRASYYSENGKVASGGRFNPNGMTAAHRTLPFGTRVRVTDPKSGKSVIVTINDRGPFGRGRVIDLSLGAAGQLEWSDEALSWFKRISCNVVAKSSNLGSAKTSMTGHRSFWFALGKRFLHKRKTAIRRSLTIFSKASSPSHAVITSHPKSLSISAVI
jgi:rare lipoprotein A